MELRPVSAAWVKQIRAVILALCVVLFLAYESAWASDEDNAVEPNAISSETPGAEPLPLRDFSSETSLSSHSVNYTLQQLEQITESRVDIVEPLRFWALKVQTLLNDFSKSLTEKNYDEAEQHRLQLEQLTIRLSVFRNTWNPLRSSGEQIDDPIKRKQEYVPSPTSLEEIQMGLERRLALWKQAISVMSGKSYPLSNHFGKGVDDIQRLQERTEAAQKYLLNEKKTIAKDRYVGELWSEHLGAKEFLTRLEACQKAIGHPNRRVAALVSTIPITMLVSFSDRANMVLAQLENPKQNVAQKRFLDVPEIVAWKKELHDWTSDTVSPLEFLATLEHYEATGGSTDMEAVDRMTDRLLVSKTPSFQRLGRLAREFHGGANVKIYISQILLNRLLPPDEPEEANFRDYVGGQPVSGQRRVEKNLALNFIPSNDRLLMALDVKGKVHTATRSNAFATTLLNRGSAEYAAKKQIELTEDGFRLLPSQVDVRNNRLELRGIRTTFDRIPIVSGVFRDIVRNQFAARVGGARAETGQKIAQQAKIRLDEEASARFNEFNQQFQNGVHGTLKSLGITLENSNSKTERDWLLTSWKFDGEGVLSGNTPAPTTLAGAFADAKIHETAFNAVIGKLDIGGQRMSVAEFRKKIATKFLRPEFADVNPDDEDVQIAFAEQNPVIVRFADGQVEISVSIASLRVNKKTHRNFKGVVTYRPEERDGKLVLVRGNSVTITGVEPLVRTQFVLRAVFGKMFPVARPLEMSPKIFETDPRFADVKAGQCRIEKGWFAVALVAKE